MPAEIADDRSFVGESDSALPSIEDDADDELDGVSVSDGELDRVTEEGDAASVREPSPPASIAPAEGYQMAKELFANKKARQQVGRAPMTSAALHAHVQAVAKSERARLDAYGMRQPEVRRMAAAILALLVDAKRHGHKTYLVLIEAVNELAAAAAELFGEIAVHPAAIEDLVDELASSD